MALLERLSRVAAGLCIFIGPLFLASASTAAPPLSVYGNLPGFETAALSPSGDKIALIGIVAEQRRLLVIDQAKKPLLVAPLGNQKVSDLTWAGDDNVLLGIRATAGLGLEFTANKAELETYVVLPVISGKPWEVFKGTSTITGGVRGFFGVAQHDGRWFGYFGGITFEESMHGNAYLTTTSPDLYEVDIVDKNIKRLARRVDSQSVHRDWAVDAQGSVVGTFDFSSNNAGWGLRNGSGKLVASGDAPIGRVELIGIGRTPNTLLYHVQDAGSSADRWMEVGADAPQEILADKAIHGPLRDRYSHKLIGYVEDADTPAEHFFDAHRNKVMEATRRAFQNMNVRLVDWNATFDRLLVTTDGPGDSGTWWLVDIKTGDAIEIGRSYPMKPQDVGPVRVVRYKAADGLELSGVLTLPPGREAKNLPIVVFPHGGPGARDYPNFDWWAQAFASRGYAVFQPNFRGSTGFGLAFQRAGDGEWGRKMQSDISDGLGELIRQGIVDSKRACIMGGSYGGYAALAGVTLQHGLYRCSVAVAGVSDLARMVQTDIRQRGGNEVLQRALKSEVGSGRDLKLVSPINFADQADAPVLLIHGKDDTVVAYAQSQAMYSALHKAGKQVEFVTMPNEDHWLSRSATRLMMLEAAVAFVEKYNPSDPTK
jgi:dipeptidyl aminopeptidase/acylaminoacyl peptidase